VSLPFTAALVLITALAFMGLPMGIAMITGSILYLLMRGQDMGLVAEQFADHGFARGADQNREIAILMNGV
jgi:hypothetical protein